MNINTVCALPTLYNNNESDFHRNYTFFKEIGKGTYSTVFLSKNKRGELVAIKKYDIKDASILYLLKKNGINVDTFIEQLAKKELLIGQLTDHPNIVKIKEVFLGKSTAYVVMNYLEGQTFDCFEPYSSKTRVIFMQQFLSAIEHFLLRNIIIDDLWSENILISSNGTHLTLLDLGGNGIINDDAEMTVGHYLEMIENMLKMLGDESIKALDNCKHFLPAALRNEIISSSHVTLLVSWIKELQQELSIPIYIANIV